MTGAARQNGPVRRRRNDAEQHLHFKLKSLNDVVCASQQQVPGRGLGAGGWKPTGSPPPGPRSDGPPSPRMEPSKKLDAAGTLPANPPLKLHPERGAGPAVLVPEQGGYKERFVKAVEDKYKCEKCRLVLCSPKQTECGHRFCETCMGALLRCVWLEGLGPAAVSGQPSPTPPARSLPWGPCPLSAGPSFAGGAHILGRSHAVHRRWWGPSGRSRRIGDVQHVRDVGGRSSVRRGRPGAECQGAHSSPQGHVVVN